MLREGFEELSHALKQAASNSARKLTKPRPNKYRRRKEEELEQEQQSKSANRTHLVYMNWRFSLKTH